SWVSSLHCPVRHWSAVCRAHSPVSSLVGSSYPALNTFTAVSPSAYTLNVRPPRHSFLNGPSLSTVVISSDPSLRVWVGASALGVRLKINRPGYTSPSCRAGGCPRQAFPQIRLPMVRQSHRGRLPRFARCPGP